VSWDEHVHGAGIERDRREAAKVLHDLKRGDALRALDKLEAYLNRSFPPMLARRDLIASIRKTLEES
jgi:hypothetical protein